MSFPTRSDGTRRSGDRGPARSRVAADAEDRRAARGPGARLVRVALDLGERHFAIIMLFALVLQVAAMILAI